MKKTTRLIRGALIITAATVITKLLGAFYRVPLTQLLGAEGIGVYQLVFPFYSILLTLSSTGIPSAISKLIAEGNSAECVLKKSLLLFGALGLLGSAVMFFFASQISAAQGNGLAALAYKTLSPSVFAVSLISCFRGYFQGKIKMLPTSLSQICEQSFKLAVGLYVCSKLNAAPDVLAAAATFSVTVSEIAALIYILITYFFSKKRRSFVATETRKIGYLPLIKVVIPITATSLLLPLSRVFDSFLAVNLLNMPKAEATAAYGLYSGGVESLVGVPVAVCYGLAVCGLPLISGDKKSNLSNKVLIYTLAVSAAAAIVLFYSSDFTVNMLYSKLSAANKTLFASLLRLSSIEVLLLSLTQSMTAVLVGLNALYKPTISLALGVAVKIAVLLFTVPTALGVYGMAISDICCYFVAAFVDLLYIVSIKKQGSLKSLALKKSGATEK